MSSTTYDLFDECFDLDLALTMVDYFSSESSNTTSTPPDDDGSNLISDMPTVAIVDTCSVCMGGPETGEEGKRMPCNHVYHANCISTWLSRYNSCPLCRSSITIVKS
ncbi:zinc finger protein [Macleaya cordata]|uniref:Zinc finger protein n=1 Tax=Macleaya cordata TaxID=56857 RepID=A0A200QDI7_MACCD|nr:zinc finger protein [Macleaya cordata]